ncbi:MAG: hypothetical protein WB563_18385, partial [Pseudolabrys sp.]
LMTAVFLVCLSWSTKPSNLTKTYAQLSTAIIELNPKPVAYTRTLGSSYGSPRQPLIYNKFNAAKSVALNRLTSTRVSSA